MNGTLRKQHSALFLVPGVIATALAAQKKGVRNACARRVAEQVPSTAPTEKTIMLSSFFSFSAKNDAALPLISKNLFQTH